MKPNKITICSTCDYGVNYSVDGLLKQLRNSIDASKLSDHFDIETVECLGACETPVTIAFQGKDKACFVFSGIDPDKDLKDIIATSETYLKAPKGWIEDARSCGRLRELLRSRVPAFGSD